MVDRVLDCGGPSTSSKTGVTVLDHSQYTVLVRSTLRSRRVFLGCILRNSSELKELGELVVSPRTSTRRIVPVALS